MSQSMMQSCRRNKELRWNSSISLARSKVIPRLQYIIWNEKILTLQEGCGCDDCRKYKAANINFFKTSDEVDRFPEEGGPMFFIYRGLPHFTVVVFFLDRQQALKFHFLDTGKSLVTFLDDEIERLKKLLFFASRYHAQMRCTKAPKDYKEGLEDTIDLCHQFRDNRISKLFFTNFIAFTNRASI